MSCIQYKSYARKYSKLTHYGKGNSRGIKYGFIIKGKYVVEDAYCWKCDMASELNGVFPQICSACPNCGNKQCRWNPPRRALSVRNIMKNAIKKGEEELPNMQWCNPT